jgi:hypothetical protein
MKTRLIITAAFFLMVQVVLLGPIVAGMYKWQDADGTWHYTNQQPPDDVDDFKAEEEIKNSGPVYTPRANVSAPSEKPSYAASSSSGNPVARVSRSKAKEDLKQDLLKTYGDSYSTVKMLLDAGMRDYDKLIRIPSSEVSDGVLNDLMGTYYPSFSTILMLYESNMKSYNELQN